MTVETALAKPVHTMLSGPAGGVVAGAHFARPAGAADVITMDVGGTSTDISLIRNGQPETTRNARIGQIPIRLPTIDINAIGAGGGSIAWIDDGGALRVGPMSAEAVPGPACYGRGGTRPTTSDANLVLGRLGSETRLGGNLRLDPAAARAAIETHIARPLGIDVVAAAVGILRVAHANIVRGIRVVSVERGHDPRAVRAGAVRRRRADARHAGCARAADRPPHRAASAGHPVRHRPAAGRSAPRPDGDAHLPLRRRRCDASPLAGRPPAGRCRRPLLAADGVPADKRQVQVRVEARYVGQSYELPHRLPLSRGRTPGRVSPAISTPRTGSGSATPTPTRRSRSSGFGATAIGKVEKPELPTLAAGGAAPPAEALAATRDVYFEGEAPGQAGGWVPARIFERAKLLADNLIEGPAVIEELSATTVLYPGDRARVHANGALLVECGTMTAPRPPAPDVRSHHAGGAAQRAGGHRAGDGRRAEAHLVLAQHQGAHGRLVRHLRRRGAADRPGRACADPSGLDAQGRRPHHRRGRRARARRRRHRQRSLRRRRAPARHHARRARARGRRADRLRGDPRAPLRRRRHGARVHARQVERDLPGGPRHPAGAALPCAASCRPT